MASIGVIMRGKYGERLVETIRQYSSLDIVVTEIPSNLPDFIDEPDEYFSTLEIDPEVFNTDILITYSLHPDLTPEIVREAAKHGVKSVIVPGGVQKAPLSELKQIASEYGIHVEVDEICCTIGESPDNLAFTSRFGIPEFEVSVSDGKISDVKVTKGAPCGSTWQMANNIIGTAVEDAPAKAGLLIQQYPCRAVRGQEGGIHKSAEIHKKAMEDALKKLKKD
ncbi:hypothetical protein J2755_000793 [Methanohalophilus levihalophilus]|uniref:DUF166 domain-containing protein n=1 Tax=Methanohalophilus levihalophilus TaxID=1431282 RepID=UPI001AE5CC7F|nr:DUF166 domain-containing protein [Methanohalophilus levihalophilus]MBP2029859.1 hypothetical protein [Methanohalophilus levihalophilus]